jgi:metal-sulfur cluster biosynthetic enzyme
VPDTRLTLTPIQKDAQAGQSQKSWGKQAEPGRRESVGTANPERKRARGLLFEGYYNRHMPVTEGAVMDALHNVYDPEIPLNIADLGLVYGVKIVPAMQIASELAPAAAEAKNDVEVDMTLTSRGCPSSFSIEQSVKSAIEQLPGVQFARVNWVWEPQWGPERISPKGREQLGIEV